MKQQATPKARILTGDSRKRLKDVEDESIQCIERGTVFPSEDAQERYPVAEHPCGRCEREGLPHLVDNSAEFYWEHQHAGSGRSPCPRFNYTPGISARPKKHTATPTYFQGSTE